MHHSCKVGKQRSWDEELRGQTGVVTEVESSLPDCEMRSAYPQTAEHSPPWFLFHHLWQGPAGTQQVNRSIRKSPWYLSQPWFATAVTSQLTLVKCRAGIVALCFCILPVSPTATGFQSHSLPTLVSGQNGYWKDFFSMSSGYCTVKQLIGKQSKYWGSWLMLWDLRPAVINMSSYTHTKCSPSPVSGRVTLQFLRGCLVQIKMYCVIIKISSERHERQRKKSNYQVCSEAARFSLQEALTVKSVQHLHYAPLSAKILWVSATLGKHWDLTCLDALLLTLSLQSTQTTGCRTSESSHLSVRYLGNAIFLS